MTDSENLARWIDAGHPHRWVWKCSGAWSDQEYADLVASLREGPFWPMKEEEVLKTLEAARTTYIDLERWRLLGNQTSSHASPGEDEIWF